MSIIPVEKTFARGGSKEFSTHPRPSFQSSPLFSTKKPRHVPRNYVSIVNPDNTKDFNNKQQRGDNTFHLKKFTGQLTYKTVAEGMLSLGAIFAINELEIKVSLPGNTVATIPITNISEKYTTALRNAIASPSEERVAPLQEMFKVGQHVVAKVVRKVLENNRNKITLSLDPEVIYSHINLDEVCKGTVVIASVKSIDDKGYVMALGKTSIRAFLGYEESSNYELIWNGGKKLGLGQIVRCYVLKATTLDSTTTLLLTAKPDTVAKANYDKTGSTLGSLMPGMKFTATVSNLFPDGIQVQLSDNFVGYVHRDHFEAPFETPKNYEAGMSVKAQVLYVLPSGVVYFTLKNSILESTPPLDPYSIFKCGEVITDAKVFNTSNLGLIIKFGKQRKFPLKGFVPINQTSYQPRHDYDESDMPVAQQLAKEFPPYLKVTCRIMDFNYLEQYFVCTMDKELMNEKIINPAMLEVGMVLQCTIESVQLRGIVLNLGKGCRATGFVPLTHISDILLPNPEKKYHPGQKCIARVLALKDGKTLFTMKRLQVESKDPILSSFKDAVIGEVYTGHVQQATERGLLIQFYNFVSGWLPRNHIWRLPNAKLVPLYDVGQLVPCRIVSKDDRAERLTLAVRDFDMTRVRQMKEEKIAENVEDVENKQHLSEWAVPEGKAELEAKSKRAAHKQMEPKKTELPTTANKSELKKKNFVVADSELATNPWKKIKAADAVKVGKLSGVQKSKEAARSKRVLRALKKQAKKEKRQLEKKMMKVVKLTKNPVKEESGDEITEVKDEKIEPTSPVSKRAAKRLADALYRSWQAKKRSLETDSQSAENPGKKRKVADAVKSGHKEIEMIESPALSRKAAKKLAAAALKAEQESKETKESKEKMESKATMESESVTSEKSATKRKNSESDAEKCEKTESNSKKHKNSESDPEPEEKKPEETKEPQKSKPVELQLPSLAVPNGFVWDATPNLLPVVMSMQDAPESSDDEEEKTTTAVKKTRQAIQNEKRVQAQQEEARLRKIEQRLMDEDSPPQSADEFDRLVLSSPDSSIVWLQYMAHHLQATEIEKAKNVGLRALKTISFREDQERLNVWGALLNLENLYGSKESLESTLEEAIKNNDAYEVHVRMLAIYGDSSKYEEGDKLISSMCKKFKFNKDMWYNAAVFYMKSSQMEKSRALLARALSFISQKDHVGIITRFALLENKLGSKERAQTLMEQVLTSYPKRVDVWGLYVDMLVKSNLVPMARQVLERAVCQRLPSHKMKTLFKKFLAFEETHGTEEDAQKVRQLALDYVESAGRDD